MVKKKETANEHKAKRLSSVIKIRFPRIITNLVIMFFVFVVFNVIQSAFVGLGTIPGSNFSSVNVIFVAIFLYFGVRIAQDILSLIEVLSEFFIDRVPYVRE